jgi:class 3 adenylate cyclase
VHVAARLAGRAVAGEILASAQTVAAAGGRPAGSRAVSLPGLARTVDVTLVPWR